MEKIYAIKERCFEPFDSSEASGWVLEPCDINVQLEIQSIWTRCKIEQTSKHISHYFGKKKSREFLLLNIYPAQLSSFLQREFLTSFFFFFHEESTIFFFSDQTHPWRWIFLFQIRNRSCYFNVAVCLECCYSSTDSLVNWNWMLLVKPKGARYLNQMPFGNIFSSWNSIAWASVQSRPTFLKKKTKKRIKRTWCHCFVSMASESRMSKKYALPLFFSLPFER